MLVKSNIIIFIWLIIIQPPIIDGSSSLAESAEFDDGFEDWEPYDFKGPQPILSSHSDDDPEDSLDRDPPIFENEELAKPQDSDPVNIRDEVKPNTTNAFLPSANGSMTKESDPKNFTSMEANNSSTVDKQTSEANNNYETSTVPEAPTLPPNDESNVKPIQGEPPKREAGKLAKAFNSRHARKKFNTAAASTTTPAPNLNPEPSTTGRPQSDDTSTVAPPLERALKTPTTSGSQPGGGPTQTSPPKQALEEPATSSPVPNVSSTTEPPQSELPPTTVRPGGRMSGMFDNSSSEFSNFGKTKQSSDQDMAEAQQLDSTTPATEVPSNNEESRPATTDPKIVNENLSPKTSTTGGDETSEKPEESAHSTEKAIENQPASKDMDPMVSSDNMPEQDEVQTDYTQIIFYTLFCMGIISLRTIYNTGKLFLDSKRDTSSNTQIPASKAKSEVESMREMLDNLKKKLNVEGDSKLRDHAEKLKANNVRLARRLEYQKKITPIREALTRLKEKLGSDIASRISDRKAQLQNLKTLRSMAEKNMELKDKMKQSRYEQLLLIKNFVRLEDILELTRDIEFNEMANTLRDSTVELKIEMELLNEQVDLFKKLSQKFSNEFQLITQELAEVKGQESIIDEELVRLRNLSNQMDLSESADDWKKKTIAKTAETDKYYADYIENYYMYMQA